MRSDEDDDVSYSNRRAAPKKVVWNDPKSATRARTRVSETIVRAQRPAQDIQAPPPKTSEEPVVKAATPPRAPSPPKERIELVSVEEARAGSPSTSRASVSAGKGKSRRESRGGEEVYIEREREIVRMPPPEKREAYETYRYVEAPKDQRYLEEERVERRRSRSITYETNPRMSGRVVERERVVIEDGGRRREYYRRQ